MLGSIISAVGSLAGGLLNNAASKAAAEEAYENQKNIIQHQTSWLVKDAKRNGIHPLAVLGVNPASGPPPAQVFDSGLGQAAGALGEAAERAMDPMQKIQLAQQRIAMEKMMADTDLTKSQVASQRMRNIQQSTPGVRSTTGNDVLVNPFTNEPFATKYPMLGQDAENAYSDVGGNVFGGAGMVADFLRNNGYDPAALYKDPIGYAASMIPPPVKLLEQATGTSTSNPNPYLDLNWGY